MDEIEAIKCFYFDIKFLLEKTFLTIFLFFQNVNNKYKFDKIIYIYLQMIN